MVNNVTKLMTQRLVNGLFIGTICCFVIILLDNAELWLASGVTIINGGCIMLGDVKIMINFVLSL